MSLTDSAVSPRRPAAQETTRDDSPNAVITQPASRHHDQFRQLVEAMADPIMVISRDGRTLYLNPRAEHLLRGDLLQRTERHLLALLPDLSSGQVRLDRAGKRDLVLRLKLEAVQWMGESAVLVSLRNVTHYMETIQDLQRQLSAHAAVIQDVNERFRQLEARTREQPSRMDGTRQELEAAVAELTALRQEREQTKAELDAALRTRAEALREADGLQCVVVDMKTTMEGLNGQIAAQRDALALAQRELAEATDRAAQEAARFEAAQAEGSATLADVQAQLADLMQNHQAQGQELIEQSAERQELKRQVEALRQENAELRKTVEEMSATHAEAERSLVRSVRTQYINARLEEEVERLRALVPPNPPPDDVPPTPAEAFKLRADFKRVTQELSELQARDMEIRKTLAKVRKGAFNAKQELQGTRQELDALNQQLAAQSERLGQVQAALDLEREQRRKVEEENRRLQQTCAELQTRLEAPRGISGLLAGLRKQ